MQSPQFFLLKCSLHFWNNQWRKSITKKDYLYIPQIYCTYKLCCRRGEKKKSHGGEKVSHVITASSDDPKGHLWKTLEQKTSIASWNCSQCGPCSAAQSKNPCLIKPPRHRRNCGRGAGEWMSIWANKWVFTSQKYGARPSTTLKFSQVNAE